MELRTFSTGGRVVAGRTLAAVIGQPVSFRLNGNGLAKPDPRRMVGDFRESGAGGRGFAASEARLRPRSYSGDRSFVTTTFLIPKPTDS
jgi:hypothetical protein